MATGDILACRIASAARDNGWVAEIDIDNLATGGTYAFGLGTNNNPSTAKIALTVTSPGYDNTGSTTTINRTVYGTMWVRQATPNNALADEAVVSTTLTVRVALSDFIYSGDTVTAVIGGGFYTKTAVPNNARSSFSVTNNSTLTHPKCVARWAWPGGDIVSGAFTLEAVVFHRSAQAGKPVAAVVFTVTDGTTTKTVTATAMTVSATSGTTGTGKVLVYKADFAASDFIQSATLTCNFTAYPWVGDSGATLTSNNGITPPDERLCPLELVCNKGATYGQPAAVVDPTNGHASAASTWVSSSQFGAEFTYGGDVTASYTTVAFAAQALKAYNNANNGRNNAGGGIVLLTTNTHAWAGNLADQGAQVANMVITRLSSKTRAQCVIASGTNESLNVRRVKLLDVTMSGNSLGQINGGGTTTPVGWVDQCTINMTGTAPFYQWRLLSFTRCDITSLPNSTAGGLRTFSTDVSPRALIRGNAFTQIAAGNGLEAEAYCVLGNKNIVPAIVQGTSAQPSDNGIYAYNQVFFLNQSACVFPPGWQISSGFAIVQNLLEKISAADTLLSVSADSAAATSNNVLLFHNTFMGERLNNGYNDSGTVGFLVTRWCEVGNVFHGWNVKTDTFPTANANRILNWSIVYGVGMRGNHRHHSKNDPEWLGEFRGLYTVTAGTMGFVNDASQNEGSTGGSGLGGGDYHLTASSSGYALLNSAVLPFDIAGTARVLANGDAGVFETQVQAGGGGGAALGIHTRRGVTQPTVPGISGRGA